jgi:hypothetical protein
MSDLTAYTDEDLLRELVRRNGTLPAPQSRMPMPPIEVVVGIGKDHHCFIALHPDALAELKGETDD